MGFQLSHGHFCTSRHVCTPAPQYVGKALEKGLSNTFICADIRVSPVVTPPSFAHAQQQL